METYAGCCWSNALEIGTRCNKKTRPDRDGIMRASMVLVCTAQMLARINSPPHLLHRDSFASDTSGLGDGSLRNSIASQRQYNTLERTNVQFARQDQHAPDPFMDQGRALSSARPYSQYLRVDRDDCGREVEFFPEQSYGDSV